MESGVYNICGRAMASITLRGEDRANLVEFKLHPVLPLYSQNRPPHTCHKHLGALWTSQILPTGSSALVRGHPVEVFNEGQLQRIQQSVIRFPRLPRLV